MTKPLSSLPSPTAVFLTHFEKGSFVYGRSRSSASAKDIFTPFFSLPTASRIQSFFTQYQTRFVETSQVGRFFSFVLRGVGKGLKKILSDPSSYDPSFVAPAKELLVPGLPEPLFHTTLPPRLFTAPAGSLDEYAPPCLMQETQPDRPMALSFAKEKLPSKGILQRDPVTGSFYLYIGPNGTYLMPQALPKGSYFPHPLSMHIPVFLPQECAKAKNLGLWNELGKEFSFEVTGCYRVDTPSHPSIEKAWFLALHAPSLENLRERYLLPRGLAGHNFHATLLMKKREEPVKPALFRLNVSCYAA